MNKIETKNEGKNSDPDVFYFNIKVSDEKEEKVLIVGDCISDIELFNISLLFL